MISFKIGEEVEGKGKASTAMFWRDRKKWDQMAFSSLSKGS
jgi:hypothetical protein